MKSWPTFARWFTASLYAAATRRRGPRAVGPVAEELDQQAGAHARRALRAGGALGLAPVGAGDVEVRPDGVARELAEEGRGRDVAAGAPAGVLHVGHVALDLLVVFFPERQLPHALAAPLAGVLELPDQRLVVPQHADGVVAQGHDAGAGQRRDVHEGGGLEALGIREAVGEDQSPLGVRVDDFDGLAGEAPEDVPGFDRVPTWHVLRGRDHGDEVEPQAEPRGRTDRRQHGGATGHVGLHLFHVVGRLERDPARIERDRLADEHHRPLAAVAAPVFQYDKLGWLVTPLA